MFRAIISPILRSTDCVSEDGRNYRPKHVELIGIINGPLLLHLVGCLYYCISDVRLCRHQIYERNMISNVYWFLWKVMNRNVYRSS